MVRIKKKIELLNGDDITYNFSVNLVQDSQELGFFDAVGSDESLLNNEINSELITSYSDVSKLSKLRKYAVSDDIGVMYYTGGSYNNNGLSIDESDLGGDVKVYVYYIDGIRYTDVGGVTKIEYYSQGITEDNFINKGIIKHPNKGGIINNPKINNDVFIDRDNKSVLDGFYRLEYVENFNDLLTYVGGKYFNIINNS